MIGSAVGGLLDSVADGATGVLVPPRDPRPCAAARWVLDNPERRRRLGEAGVARARRLFGWPHVAARTLDTYRALAAGSPSWAVPA